MINRPTSKQPIPDHAKKVFEGKIFDVYQWPQEQYDGSSIIFEKIKRRDTVSLIPVTEDKKILLTKQSQPSIPEPFYSPVGGIIDSGEDPLRAVHRELKEETGYETEKMELWFSYQASYKVDWALYMFIAKNCRQVAGQQLDPGEKIEVVAVTFEEFFEIAIEENFRDQELAKRLLKAYYTDPTLQEIKYTLGLS